MNDEINDKWAGFEEFGNASSCKVEFLINPILRIVGMTTTDSNAYFQRFI